MRRAQGGAPRWDLGRAAGRHSRFLQTVWERGHGAPWTVGGGMGRQFQACCGRGRTRYNRGDAAGVNLSLAAHRWSSACVPDSGDPGVSEVGEGQWRGAGQEVGLCTGQFWRS